MSAVRVGSFVRANRPGAGLRLLGLLLAGVIATSLDAGIAQAQGLGDLVVSPTRLVFEGRTRSEQVVLSNQGTETATYRISLIDMAMDETGNLKAVDQPPPGASNAAKLIRYAPPRGRHHSARWLTDRSHCRPQAVRLGRR